MSQYSYRDELPKTRNDSYETKEVKPEPQRQSGHGYDYGPHPYFSPFAQPTPQQQQQHSTSLTPPKTSWG